MKLPDWLLNWIIINHILNWMLPWTAFLILPRWLTASYFIFVSYAEKITNITVSQWLSVWLQKHSHETVINIQRTTPPQAKHFSHSASVFLSVMVSTCSYYLSTVFVCVCVVYYRVEVPGNSEVGRSGAGPHSPSKQDYRKGNNRKKKAGQRSYTIPDWCVWREVTCFWQAESSSPAADLWICWPSLRKDK